MSTYLIRPGSSSVDGGGIGNGRGVRTLDTDRRGGAPRRVVVVLVSQFSISCSFLHRLWLVALATLASKNPCLVCYRPLVNSDSQQNRVAGAL